MASIILFGGYGIFGSLVGAELARAGISVTVAGRSAARAADAAQLLGSNHRALAVDLTSPDSVRSALEGHAVAVCCAGPFARLGTGLLEACLDAGCHYVDIAEDRTHAALVRAHDQRFGERGLVAAYGCSSLPGISGALATWLKATCKAQPQQARATLFIGNRNPKGSASIRSLIGMLGKPIAAPQGMLRGFGDREIVPLPAPFGQRAVFNCDSPEYDLFPELLGVTAVSVKVGFELRPANYTLALLAKLPKCSRWTRSDGLARMLTWMGKLCNFVGSSGGAVMTELLLADGSVRRACLLARQDGQHMAALPCALVTQAIVENSVRGTGALTAFQALGAERLLEGLVSAGFKLYHDDGQGWVDASLFNV